MLDEAFRVPGTVWRFGWDPIIGLLPGVGDLVTGVMSATIVVAAHQLRVPKVVQLRMLANVAVDLAIGVMPVAGDVADAFWKSNTRNLALLERFAGGVERPSAGDWLFAAAVVAAILVLAAAPLALLVWSAAVLFDRGLF
jgi:hypothetical protein